MCLGIPMQITGIDGLTARCEAKGVSRETSLLMLAEQEVAVGDYIVISMGYAIEKISEQAARDAWEIYDQILAAESGTAQG